VKHVFGEWYEPEDAELKEILQSGTIALDTNVLLDLYRIGADQRSQILDLFKKEDIRQRIWIPFQVGLEYQRRRLDVAKAHQPQYEKIKAEVSKLKSSLEASINAVRDVEVRKLIKESVAKHLDPAIEQINSKIDKLQEQHVIDYKAIRKNDPLRVEIDTILRDPGQVGPAPSEVEVEERKQRASERYEKEIPPGYKDAAKSANSEGDALVWFEILDHAASVNRPVIFVTSDVKEDWYRLDHGHTLGPRIELRAEFSTRSSHQYHQTNLSSFLYLANNYLNGGVRESAIHSVEALDKARRMDSRRKLEASQLQRLQRASTEKALLRALELYKPGSSMHEHIQAGLDLLSGKRAYDAGDVMRALRALDITVRAQSSNSNDRQLLASDLTSEQLDRINQYVKSVPIPTPGLIDISDIQGKLPPVLGEAQLSWIRDISARVNAERAVSEYTLGEPQQLWEDINLFSEDESETNDDGYEP